MKIVQVAHHFSPCMGGVESVVLELSKRLVKRGHGVRVVCLDRCAKSGAPIKGGGAIQGIEVRRIPFLDLNYYKIAPSVLRHVRDADVIHVHSIGFLSDSVLATKPLHRRPVVVSTHGGIMHTRRMSLLKRAYAELWLRFALKLADTVIADSDNDEKFFSKICGKGRIRRIANGIDFEKFDLKNIKAEKNTFIYVGRLSRNKRVDNLIETFAFMKKWGVKFRLSIIGQDFDGIAAELKELVKSRGLENEISFFGALGESELAGNMARAEYFVSASEYEGFGISPIESMVSGSHVIANRIDAFTELIDDKKNGFLVNYSEPETAAREITGIMKMPAEEKRKISRNAIEFAKKYSWETKAHEFEEVYNSVVKKTV